jgi:hypothetical protein
MSTKKTKSNGAAHAPVTPVLTDASAVTDKQSKTNGKTTKSAAAFVPSEFDGLIDTRELLKVLAEVRNGNFTVRMPNDGIGLSGKIYDTLNDIITLNELLVQEMTEARKIICKQGKLNHRG